MIFTMYINVMIPQFCLKHPNSLVEAKCTKKTLHACSKNICRVNRKKCKIAAC